MWFWHTSTSDRQDFLAGQFTGQRFLFIEPIASVPFLLPMSVPD
ncbi:hypothetical protein [Burkholderia ambifaria]|nr:hypothetical protein [Burkholderia ambifaria]